jgi:organic hydroperoxide reductase OsmC/OhrA
MGKQHNYSVSVKWTGNRGEGTSGYTAYDRSHSISVDGKPELLCSSDTAFRGDSTKYNPEDMLLASLSACHMLWYLHLCADAGIIVIDYSDHASGVMTEDPAGGKFTEATLHPVVTITDEAMIPLANELHMMAHKKCFIANSVNFPVRHMPSCVARPVTYKPA